MNQDDSPATFLVDQQIQFAPMQTLSTLKEQFSNDSSMLRGSLPPQRLTPLQRRNTQGRGGAAQVRGRADCTVAKGGIIKSYEIAMPPARNFV